MASEISKSVDVQSLVRAFFRDDWMTKAGVGGVLTAAGLLSILYSFVCLPFFAALWALMIGYSLRCMRVKVANADEKLPKWDQWGDLFLSGITWMALQTGIWLAFAFAQGFLMYTCIEHAFYEKNLLLSQIWTYSACVFVAITAALLAMLSSYVMVNFAIEENVKAGFAYRKVILSLLRSPRNLFAGFLLASGMQYASVLLPCVTVIGIFVLPSCFFVGSIVSGIILAQQWSACNEIEKKPLSTLA